MNRSSSTRLTRAPTPPTAISSTAMMLLLGGSRRLYQGDAPAPRAPSGTDGRASRRHLLGRPLDGLDDVLVAGAAADVPGDGPADVLLAGVRVVLQERRRRQHHARRAEPALQAVLLLEAFLDGVQLARPAQALHGG